MTTFRREAPILIAELERLGATDCRLEHGGKHPRIVYVFRGRKRMHVLPCSGSDPRGLRNGLADIRRELGAKRRSKPSPPRVRRQKAPEPPVKCPRLTVPDDPWESLRELRSCQSD